MQFWISVVLLFLYSCLLFPTGWPSHVLACQIPDLLFSDPVAEQRTHYGNWTLQKHPHALISVPSHLCWRLIPVEFTIFLSLAVKVCLITIYSTLEIFWENICCVKVCAFWKKITDMAYIAFTIIIIS